MQSKILFPFARTLARILTLVLALSSLLLFGGIRKGGLAAAAAVTPTRTPTRTPTPRSATISLNSGNKTKPRDVLQQLYLAGLGGGPGAPSDCYVSTVYPFLSNVAESRQELFAGNDMYACGWTEGEQVNLQVQYPNGKVVQKKITAETDAGKDDDAIYTYYEFKPAWTDPTGTYRLTFTGSSGQVTTDVSVFRPAAPRVVVFENHSMLLYRFAPNENVRLFAYGDCGNETVCLQTWQAFQTDRQGSLSISLGSDMTGLAIFLVGESSGEFGDPYGFSMDPGSHELYKRTISQSEVLVSSCPGAPPQRLKTGYFGRVCTKVDRVKVRQSPSRSSPEIIRLEPGQTFDVTDGPVCADNWSWYKIDFKGGKTGWIAEGGDSTDPYFICPDY
jgi:hypothetical protein